MKAYYLLVRRKRHAPIEVISVMGERNRRFVEQKIRCKGYKVLFCGSEITIDNIKEKGRIYFLKTNENLYDDSWEIIETFDYDKYETKMMDEIETINR